ncbi:hypothetical protein V6O07_23040, partial [Arthrospira platensis SPKY2]
DALVKSSQIDNAISEYRRAVNLQPESNLFNTSYKQCYELLQKINYGSHDGKKVNEIDVTYENDLRTFFETNTGRVIHKWVHYFEIYELYFNRFRKTDVHFLEIGVSHGGSLQMWKKYFGPKATIYGVDIDSRCKQLEDDQIKIFIGDQANIEFWTQFKKEVPKLDIVLDDGGHKMLQQINSFEALFGHISKNGIYMVEDLCTSYWNQYGGGYKHNNTFIEYSKNLIDYLNAWYSQDESSLKISDFTRDTWSINYYSNVMVIEKREIKEPYHKKTGGIKL